MRSVASVSSSCALAIAVSRATGRDHGLAVRLRPARHLGRHFAVRRLAIDSAFRRDDEVGVRASRSECSRITSKRGTSVALSTACSPAPSPPDAPPPGIARTSPNRSAPWSSAAASCSTWAGVAPSCGPKTLATPCSPQRTLRGLQATVISTLSSRGCGAEDGHRRDRRPDAEPARHRRRRRPRLRPRRLGGGGAGVLSTRLV